jgi:hypothetical protein
MSDFDLAEVARTLRSPFVPSALRALAAPEGYLERLWPALRASVETAGFRNSALYMADMALDAVEEVYEPVLSRDAVLAGGVSDKELAHLLDVIDVFHYVQPQVLLLCAALAEAWERPQMGGQGRVDTREVTERERHHLETEVPFAPEDTGLLPLIAEALGTEAPPDLYRAAASWPAYLELAWEELQHLAAYPQFRRRGRGLYYYARTGARFLAEPIEANPEALRTAGLSDGALERAKAALDRELPALAMMLMHAEAMRAGLGVSGREVVQG